MAHMLEIDSDGVAKMFSTVLTPWHGLGQVLDAPPTSEEAIRLARMDWTVEKRPIYFLEKSIVTPTAREQYIAVPNRVALVRSSDRRLLSVVSNEYEPLQNTEAFAFFDPLIKDGLATYETAGVLCEGRKIWIQAKTTKEMKIGDDLVVGYLLLCSGHDGSTGVLVQPGAVRVVCANTLRLSLSQGHVFTFAHRGGVQQRIELVKETLGLVLSKLDVAEEQFKALAAHKIDSEKLSAYLADVYQVPQVDIPTEGDIRDGELIEKASTWQRAAIHKTKELFETGRGVTELTRSTFWGAYGAVIEFVDYFAGARAKDRGNYLMFGAGAAVKERALDIALGA